MDFELTEEQQRFKVRLEKFSKEEIDPLLASYDPYQPLPKEACLKIIRRAKPLGLLGARIPVEYGGSGLGPIGLALLAEMVDPAAYGQIIGVEIPAFAISLGGDERLRQRFLPSMLAGEKICSNAVSEPNVGSDPRGIETKAVLFKDEYIINGTKLWIRNGDICDIMVVTVSVGKDERGRNLLSSFIVEREVSPFKASPLETLGDNQSHLAEVVLEDCHVPKQNILAGVERRADKMQRSIWLSSRPIHSLCAVRCAKQALDTSIKYAREEKQFAKAIGSSQSIQAMIAEMATLVWASRVMCYQAINMAIKGIPCVKETSMAKYFVTEVSVKVTSMAMQLCGVCGSTRDYQLEKNFRDVRQWTIAADGTTQIQQLIIGRELLGIRAFS